ncbi:RAD protein (Pv-fam-e) [Plasmodium vivax India VII]|uniref:RAD protein (Pv-fam-e) n=1 Tax=Plasmodium vivax India VII TaxID=1077284 RepID=A0A0J9SG47_PLAVI|nr:RAD protein (Pv-fam-e) [Plasmodium vivax India VII]
MMATFNLRKLNFLKCFIPSLSVLVNVFILVSVVKEDAAFGADFSSGGSEERKLPELSHFLNDQNSVYSLFTMDEPQSFLDFKTSRGTSANSASNSSVNSASNSSVNSVSNSSVSSSSDSSIYSTSESLNRKTYPSKRWYYLEGSTEDEVKKQIKNCGKLFLSKRKAQNALNLYDNYMKSIFYEAVSKLEQMFYRMATKHGMPEEVQKKQWVAYEEQIDKYLEKIERANQFLYDVLMKINIFGGLAFKSFFPMHEEVMSVTFVEFKCKWANFLVEEAKAYKDRENKKMEKKKK